MTTETLTGEVLELDDAVSEQLLGHGRVGVSYSGGVDSATLLALAVRALGSENVVALLGVSPSLARRERRLAHRVAAVIGAEVIEVPTSAGVNPDYQKNDASRCFHCNNELFTRIDDEIVAAQLLDAAASGASAGAAARKVRPASGAATQQRVRRPLSGSGMTKEQVRMAARERSLPAAD